MGRNHDPAHSGHIASKIGNRLKEPPLPILVFLKIESREPLFEDVKISGVEIGERVAVGEG
jgi:hypothetical protein